MSLFSSNDCTAHHFEVSSTKDDWRVCWETPHYVLKKRANYKCAHTGCHETKSGWETIERYHVNKNDEGKFKDEKMKELIEVLQFFREQDGDENE
jgi:hypothetical protein